MPSAELEAIISAIRAQPPLEEPSVDQMRAAADSLCQMFPVAADVTVERLHAGGVPAEWVAAPGVDPGCAVLYLHGGGYVLGSTSSHRELASRLSRAAGARVLTIDYRLAPEHPHPAAVEDAMHAYGWLLAEGMRPDRIVVAGDSAGGGLTVATLVAIRDAGLPLPAAGICLSPWVDMEAIGESMTTRAAADPMVQPDHLRRLAEMYLAGQDPRTPLAAPLYADLVGLPPLLIHVGTAETLFDDATRLTARARAAGVDVTLEPWDAMIHVWHLFAAALPEGQQAVDRVGAFIRTYVPARLGG